MKYGKTTDVYSDWAGFQRSPGAGWTVSDTDSGIAPQAKSGTVTGIAFDDANQNGVFDQGEKAKSGWTVFLDANQNGRIDIEEQVTTTAKDGSYSFTKVAGGTYDVVMRPAFGWEHWSFGGDSAKPAFQDTSSLTPIERLQAAVAKSQAAITASGHQYYAPDFSVAHANGQLIVKLADPNMTSLQSAELMQSVGAHVVKSTVGLGVQLWQVDGMSIEDATAKLMATGKFAYVNPNYTLELQGHADADAKPVDPTPNDPFYHNDYGLPQVNAPAVWNYGTGSSSVVVGDIDTGTDLTHPDLKGNLWVNPGEIVGNGKDDDKNGYVDDVYGYDFIHGDSTPQDEYGHGSHTAGTIGAEGDNKVGVAGVNWDVSIMTLQIFDENGSTDDMSAILAVEYATMMGVQVTNNSWGGGGFDNGLYDAIASGGLFVAAAGNNSSNNDAFPFYPATYNLDNIISVASVDSGQRLSGFSDYGARTVDLAAPGSGVYSTVPVSQGSYAYYSGTSMATPHVAGAIALIMSLMPDLSLEQIKQALIDGVNPLSALQGKVLSEGELNILGSLMSVGQGVQTVKVGGGTVTADFAAHSAATVGDDTLQGYNLAERIGGGAGNDTIKAGAGNDVVIGGAGADHLYGESGADTFYFDKKSGADTVHDFSTKAKDLIQINASGVDDVSDLTIVSNGHGGALVSFGAVSIDVLKVAPGDLGAGSFAFGALAAPVELEARIAMVHAVDLMHPVHLYLA